MLQREETDMKQYMIILLTGAFLLSGCEKQEPAAVQEAVTTAVTETTSSPAATTAGELHTTVPKTTETSAVTTVPATSDTVPGTTATTERLAVFRHAYALSNTALGTRPVPEKYLDTDAENIPRRAASAVSEGREMVGDCGSCCADPERDCLYICMYYGLNYDDSAKYDYTLYRLDADGTVTECCDFDSVRDVYKMFVLKGRLMLATYHGFYYIDTESGDVITVDEKNEPLGGSLLCTKERVYLITPNDAADGTGPFYRMYDPAANTLTEITSEQIPDEAQTLYEYSQNDEPRVRISTDGERGGIQNYIFEWG